MWLGPHLCDLHGLVAVQVPHLGCLVTGGGEHFTAVLLQQNRQNVTFNIHTLAMLLLTNLDQVFNNAVYTAISLALHRSRVNHVKKPSPVKSLHHSSTRQALGPCASAEPWERSVHYPAPPSTAPAVRQQPQHDPVSPLHMKQANILYSSFPVTWCKDTVRTGESGHWVSTGLRCVLG